MKYCIYFLFGMFFLIGGLHAQAPLKKIDFENQPAIRTITGIVGKAFNLGDVDRRKPLIVDNPLKKEHKFTVLIWVRGDLKAASSYDILSSATNIEHDDEGWKSAIKNGTPQPVRNYQGWKIGMQHNGAWQFSVRGKSFTYEYIPTPYRQNIRDGKWHMLGVSYDKAHQEMRFYFDGMQKAIYNVEGLDDLQMADSLTIGSSADNGFDINKIDAWDSFYGEIDDVSLYNRVMGAEEIKSHYEQITNTILPNEVITGTRPKSNPIRLIDNKMHISSAESIELKSLKVTSFNILHGGNFPGKEVGRNRIIEVMKQENADIFTMVETYGSGAEIADALNYHLYLISSNLSIMSRYPITKTYPIFKSFNSGGAQVDLPGNQKVNVFTIWLYHLPIRTPLSKPHADVQQFIQEESGTRGLQMRTILKEINKEIAESDEIPLIMGGDFNAGSHLDWNKDAASIHHGNVVPFTASTAAVKAGLIDSYRKIYPDPVKFPGITWSPMRELPDERLDFIYYKGKKLSPINSTVIDYHPIEFPSDHAALSTLFKWNSGNEK